MRILLIDDDEALAKVTSKILGQMGHQVLTAHSGAQGLEQARATPVDLILLDLQLPDMTGTDVLGKLNTERNRASVVLVTGAGSVDAAVAAMKLGAEDFLEKPVDSSKLKAVVTKIAEKRGLLEEIEDLKKQRQEMYRKDYLFLPDPEMRKLYAKIEEVAQFEKVTVNITGETGTGKEHVARLVHAMSPRRSKPFVELHCGSLPETILESELFGYEPGAFTDAKRQKPGLFEEAQGGSIFLDEIGELTAAVQMKLLKVLEQKTIRRLGGTREIPLDVRIITATHRSLENEVKEGRFREDLFYRLNVVPLVIPALRERPKDIGPLANFFFQESCQAFGKKLNLLSDEVLGALGKYAWPGNVRELKHVIERMVVTAKGPNLTLKDLPKEVREAKALPQTAANAVSRDEAEKKNIQKALTETGGNKTKAAELLGITRKTLFTKLKKYSLE